MVDTPTTDRTGAAELVLLVGPSGAGKSTLLLLLAGLLDTGPDGWLVSGQLACGGRSFDLAGEPSDIGGDLEDGATIKLHSFGTETIVGQEIGTIDLFPWD